MTPEHDYTDTEELDFEMTTTLLTSDSRRRDHGRRGRRHWVRHRSDYFYPDMTPEPDYTDTEDDSDFENDNHSADERLRDDETMEDDGRRHRVRHRSGGSSSRHRSSSSSRNSRSSEDLIQPRKPSNPYLESMERRNLHKELKFNQKHGKTVGSQKTELQRAIEKYTEGKIKRDLAASRRTSLEKILEQQAQKIEQQERNGSEDSRPSWIDRLQRQHITSREDPKTDEFFRVHARVVSRNSEESASPSESE
ncbi:hypothetical protein JTE90_009736 [Oedothorax gibbosus]|uniref:Uncharacterized protein n=1 Tax=Oedothorax gibbosus TaxID=931172 RepID=A0AAV6V9C5_9ARAC|nr:hypothetical protein JTE90_009736 [Oedothorax gibbosus]